MKWKKKIDLLKNKSALAFFQLYKNSKGSLSVVESKIEQIKTVIKNGKGLPRAPYVLRIKSVDGGNFIKIIKDEFTNNVKGKYSFL